MRNLILLFFLVFVNLAGFAQITINLPLTRSVFQRDNNNASTIYISGIYEDLIEKIEARLVPVKVGQGVATDWIIVSEKCQALFHFCVALNTDLLNVFEYHIFLGKSF